MATTEVPGTGAGEREAGIPTRLVVVLAVAAGVTVANLYYAQPLLDTIAEDFGASKGTAGLAVTATQIGYAVGLAFVVPIGDLVERRTLTTRMVLALGALLVCAVVAPSLWFLIGVLALVGLAAVVAQILVPLAAGLAADGQRGAVVGKVMTGLLLGILLGRTVAGLVADVAGWRAVYGLGAALALILAAVLHRELPDERRPAAGLAYRDLLRSSLELARTQPELRRSAVLGALGFAAFSVFWTTIAFLLAAEPFDYSDAAIGLLGLAGAAGALCALTSGRLADRGLARPTRVVAAALVASSFLILWTGRTSIIAVVAGVVVLDVGVQGIQVVNQSVIYELAPAARSRINSVYMTIYFIGGALGSAVAGFTYDHGGWGRVCLLGGIIGTLAVATALRRPRPAIPEASLPAAGAPADDG